MVNAKDVYPNDLIGRAAEEIKKIEAVKPPVWTAFSKTGAHKERAPEKKDWWYSRVAAVLRSVYVLGPIGVSKLRTKYGGKKRRGHPPAVFRKGSGSIIRKALQQLEKAGFIKFVEKGIHKGRIVTPQGKSFLDKIAVQLLKEQRKNKPKAEKPVEKVEVKKEEKKPEIKKEVKQEKPKEEKKPEIKQEKQTKKPATVSEPQK